MSLDKLIDAIGMIDETAIKEAKETKKKTIRFPLRKLAIAATLALVCLGTVPVLAAADVDSAYHLLYSISPAIAQKLKPVNLSCIDQGIQMEVASAYIHGNTAEAIICLKDLNGTRIDETIDLFDSYDIRNIQDSSGTCSLLDYNSSTGVAAFSVLMEQMGNKPLSGEKVTFSVSKLLCNKKEFRGTLDDISLSAVNEAPALTDDVVIRGGGGSPHPDDTLFLVPASAPLSTPISGATLTGIGYENGKLHVQMCYENIHDTDNHGWLMLQHTNGAFINCTYSEAFWDSTRTDSYQEYVFTLPYEELQNYKLYGEFVCAGSLVEGDWQVTFPMEQVK